jgi:membrane associated rhomboid family serine protease
MSYQDSYDRPQMQLAMPRLTPVVKVLMIANAVVHLVKYLVYMVDRDFEPVFVKFLGLNPEWWSNLWFPVWQLVTYAFVHQDLWHLFFNMLQLYFFGTMLESIVGSRRFAVFYTAAFLIGGVLHLVAELTWGAGAIAIGASGATVAVMIAMAVLRPKTMVIVLFIPVQLWILSLVIVGMDVMRLLDDARGYNEMGGIAYMVHLGGAGFGYLAVKKSWIWKDPIEARARKRDVEVTVRVQRDDQRMDELLAKIHREGMNGLSRQEKEFLKRMSKR